MEPDQVGAVVIIATSLGMLLGARIERTWTRPASANERRRIIWIDGYPYVERVEQ
jgi:hypothetical protein